MRVQLDRFEDTDVGVLFTYPEGKRSFEVSRRSLPGDASPGDVFTVRFEHDRDESARMERENRGLMDDLLNRGET